MPRVHRFAACRLFSTVLSLSLIITLALPLRAAAQTTRAEQIAAEQAEKSQQLAPEEAGKAEKLVVRALSSPLVAGTGGLYPWFGSVFGGSGFAAGVGYLHRLPNKGGLSFIGSASVNGSLMADADWRISVPARTRLRPRLNAHWVDANKVSSYGTGSRTEPEDKTQYDYSPTRVQGFLDADALPWLTVSGNLGYMDMSTSAGFQGTFPDFAGLGESIQFVTTGAGITADWRTSPLYSTRGGFVRATWSRYDARDDAPFTFDTHRVRSSAPLSRAARTVRLRLPRAGDDDRYQRGQRRAIRVAPRIWEAAIRSALSRIAVFQTAAARWRPPSTGGDRRGTSTWRCSSMPAPSRRG
jgi:hypothetical protein